MDDAKIYNVCLMRVTHQVRQAKQRLNDGMPHDWRIILESYNTGEMEDIIDILEIYDLDDRTAQGLTRKLEDLAYTVSVLVKEEIAFDYDEKGNLGLYFVEKQDRGQIFSEAETALAAAS